LGGWEPIGGKRTLVGPGGAGRPLRVDRELVGAAAEPETARPERSAVGDRGRAPGNLGALANVYPAAGEQRCWNHRILNVLDKVPQKAQGPAKVWLRQITYAPTRAEAGKLKGKFQTCCQQRSFPEAGHLLEADWERLVAYYDYPAAHWGHRRTTNPVESPFAAARLRTSAAKRLKRVENATAMLWKLLRVAEQHFRKLNAPELLAKVAAGVRYVDGRQEPIGELEERIAA
jgi:putative transposase